MGAECFWNWNLWELFENSYIGSAHKIYQIDYYDVAIMDDFGIFSKILRGEEHKQLREYSWNDVETECGLGARMGEG